MLQILLGLHFKHILLYVQTHTLQFHSDLWIYGKYVCIFNLLYPGCSNPMCDFLIILKIQELPILPLSGVTMKNNTAYLIYHVSFNPS